VTRDTATPRAAPRAHLPPRLLPVLYFGLAHVAFALACLIVAVDPRGVSGFFYHPRMLAIVHLVTLGWITAAILGSLYIVGPVAMRVWIPATSLDYTAFALVLIGIVGMVGHFWLQEYGGMAWSAITVGAGITLVGVHVVPIVFRSSLPKAVAAHIALAFVNILAAATAGVLIGFDKVYHFLPGFVLANVFAHAHLATLGWATMMVVGVAYRLLPMILPAAMPSGPRLWLSVALLQTGVTGLFLSLVSRQPFTWVCALIVVGGLSAFFYQVAWMLGRPRPRPPRLRSPDPAVLHAAASFTWLAVACILGVWLTLAAPSPNALRVAMAYGVFGLVGFLAQMVVGMEGRLLPIFAWYWAYAGTGYRGPVTSQHDMPWRTGQKLAFALWLFGVPALAGGLAFDYPLIVSAAGWSLFVAAVVDSVSVTKILRHAFQPGSVDHTDRSPWLEGSHA
jgi:hypothetical protein